MKNLRTSVLKESIADFTDIAKTIKENTSATVQALLRDAVAQEYVKIMSEGFDKDEDEEETEEIETNDIEAEDTTEDTEEVSADVEGEESDFEENDDEEEIDETESAPEDWEEFEDYKIDGADDQYDFTKADDDTVVKVYKLLKNSDEVVVDMDSEKNKLELKDNQTGAEYLIDLDSMDQSCCDDDSCECEFEIAVDDEDDDAYGDDEFNNNIKESRMVEIVLNEDTNLGYTDSYQSDDVLTTPSMKEPGRGNDWDAGVPKGKSKPWAGKGTAKKGAPFCEEEEMGNDEEMAMEDEMMDGDAIEECNVPTKDASNWGLNHTAKKGNKVPVKDASHWGLDEEIEECGTVDEEDEMMEGDEIEEATNVGGAVQQRSMSKSHIPSGRKKYGPYTKHHVSTEGSYSDSVTESMKRKHDKIVAENKKMKQALNNLHQLVQEAAVTNMNLGQIVKLLNENSTTQEEKREIISRFGKEAKTIQESKDLYAKISRELQKKSVMNINEEKQFTTENSNKINENTIYSSKDLIASLDLMHKICK